MKVFPYIAYALTWVSVSVAASIGIYVTGSLMPLWVFILPATISLTSSETDKNKGEGNNEYNKTAN